MLIKNAKIYTMEGYIIENGYVLVKEGKIISIGEMKNINCFDDEVINLEGKSLYPGFIDAHTHLGMIENALTFEGDDGNEENDPIMPNLRAIDAVNTFDKGFLEALEFGITTVVTGPGSANPIGGQLIALKTYGTRIDDMVIKSPVAIKFALGENPKAVYSDKNQLPMTRMATTALIREHLYKAKQYLENKRRSEKKEDTDFPDYDAKCEALIPVLEKKIKVHFHAHRADDIFTAIRIAKEFNLDYVIVHGTEGHLIKEHLKKENSVILSGPILCHRSKPELINLTTMAPGILSKEGILTTLITDHPEVPIQYLTLCGALAIRDGMDKEKALEAITINPAKICAIDNRVGSIAVGKDADFVVYDGDPFDIYIKPALVIAGGVPISLK
ncbi:MAG: Amidohydrolase [Eubacteriales bacterium SKADARSKE-1]|nr:Amidohydrolase [Eubacteriales bacterium SKADARSKE-1]